MLRTRQQLTSHHQDDKRQKKDTRSIINCDGEDSRINHDLKVNLITLTNRAYSVNDII